MKRLFTILVSVLVTTSMWGTTAYVSNYTELSAAVSNTSVDNIVVIANIDVPCENSGNAGSTDLTGTSTAQLIIKHSLTLQSQVGSKYCVRRVAASGATNGSLKSMIAIRGNGNGDSGTLNLTENTIEVSFTNIIIDGGANFKNTSVCDRKNGSATSYGYAGRSMIDVYLGATLNLEDGTEVRNGFTSKSDNSLLNDASTSQNFGGAVRVDYHNETGGGTVNIKAGAYIHDCATQGSGTGYGGALGAYNYARLNLYGGTISNCYSAHGGAIGCTYRGASGYGKGSAGVIRMYGGTISDCCGANGGAISTDGYVEDYILGGTITSCTATNKGAAICIPESGTTVNMVAYNSHLLTISNCTDNEATATGTDGYSNVYKNADATIALYPVYQVTFMNDNTTFAVLSVAQNTSLGEAFPAAPAVGDRRFVGWYNGNTLITRSTTITGNMTVTAKWDFLGNGTSSDPYLIPSTAAWNLLAEKVNAGNSYSSQFFQQTADISVTKMIGFVTSQDHNWPFSGNYDGNNHTLNVTLSGSGEHVAPFLSLQNATINNLHITGSISTTDYRPASITSYIYGVCSITNCWSEVALSSSKNNHWVDCGAFVARVSANGSLTMTGCLFTGSMTFSNNGYEAGGMVGWTQGNVNVTLNDCVFAPSAINITNYTDIKMFVAADQPRTLNNCYYNDVAGATNITKEGEGAHSVSAGSGVTVTTILGAPTASYSVSGLSFYGSNGYSLNGEWYGGNGDAISLNLTHADAPVGYSFSSYSADHGTVSGSDNPYTLTMANADAVISANWDVNTSISLDDNDATMPSILSALNDGNARNITINRPLLRNGDYNTLCVPFNLSAEQLADPACPLYNCSISELTDMWVAGNELRLLMSPVSSIEAGKPYLVRYKGETTNLASMVFNGVTVSASAGGSTDANGATMYGVLEPTHLAVGKQNYLFLVAGNQLNWPNVDSPIKSFRAYFVVDGSNNGGSAPVRRGMPARIVEHYDTTTDVEAVGGQQSAVSCQKVLRDGQLIIIRNGVEYNAMGQIIK